MKDSGVRILGLDSLIHASSPAAGLVYSLCQYRWSMLISMLQFTDAEAIITCVHCIAALVEPEPV